MQAERPARAARAERRTVTVAPARSTREEAERPPPGETAREHRGVTREDAEQLSFELPRENGEHWGSLCRWVHAPPGGSAHAPISGSAHAPSPN